MSKEKPTIEDIVRTEYEKGNITFMMSGGLTSMNLNDFIKQPTDGMLYDLNRSEEVILTFIDDPKWVNDFAVCKVIRKLKERIEELEKKLLTFTSKTT